MSSAKKRLNVTSVHYDMDMDVDSDVDQDTSALEIVDRAPSFRVTVHPQPLLARNTAGRRNYFMPQCESEWIHMVNRANGGADGSFYLPQSAYAPRFAHSARSISANSYFDPYTLRTGSTNTNVPETQSTNQNNMSRHQMERAYQRVCNEKGSTDLRTRSMSSKAFRDFGGKNDPPILTTRPAPLEVRSYSAAAAVADTDRSKRRIGDNTASASAPAPASASTAARLETEREKATLLPDKALVDLKCAAIPSPRSPAARKDTWCNSAPYRYDRARIVRKSPPWRSLLNRRPQGVRGNGVLCPNHCRCCFEKSYNTVIKDVFKLDA